MDKWKILAIFALLGGIGGYGYISARQPPTPVADPTPAPVASNAAANSAQPVSDAPAPPQPQGKPLPDWSIPAELWTNAKAPISPADLKGSVALVEFFRIGCSHCQQAAPFMEEIYKKYTPRGLKIVALHSPGKGDPEESNWQTVKGRMREWGVTYPVAFDQSGAVFRSASLRTYPSIMVTGKDGVVRYFRAGHTAESEKALLAYLEEALPKK